MRPIELAIELNNDLLSMNDSFLQLIESLHFLHAAQYISEQPDINGESHKADPDVCAWVRPTALRLLAL